MNRGPAPPPFKIPHHHKPVTVHKLHATGQLGLRAALYDKAALCDRAATERSIKHAHPAARPPRARWRWRRCPAARGRGTRRPAVQNTKGSEDWARQDASGSAALASQEGGPGTGLPWCRSLPTCLVRCNTTLPRTAGPLLG
jgi:hypothetical protein